LLAGLAARVAAARAERVNELGLTAAQFAALEMIEQRAGLSQAALAWRLGIVGSRATKLADELEELGLMTRQVTRDDRRRRRLHVTAAGAERIAAVRQAVRDHDARVAAALTAEEMAIALTLLRKLATDGDGAS
jgi:DNA-binding MarR family transcriptional regulator